MDILTDIITENHKKCQKKNLIDFKNVSVKTEASQRPKK